MRVNRRRPRNPSGEESHHAPRPAAAHASDAVRNVFAAESDGWCVGSIVLTRTRPVIAAPHTTLFAFASSQSAGAPNPPSPMTTRSNAAKSKRLIFDQSLEDATV